MAGGFTPEEIKKFTEMAESIGKGFDDAKSRATELEKSVRGYMDTLARVQKIEKNIAHQSQLKLQAEEEYKKLKDKVLRTEKLLDSKSGRAAAWARNNIGPLKEQLASREGSLKVINKQLVALKDTNKELKASVKHVNKYKLGFNAASKAVGGLYGGMIKGYQKLKNAGAFEMDRAFREVGRSMNVTKGEFKGFEDRIVRAKDTTNKWGVSTKELVKAQGTYSDEIGRSVMLSEAGLHALAKIGEGTGIGVEGAAQMAAEMDKFGMSVVGSSEIMQHTLDIARKMGVNATKVTKNLQNNLKLAQKYHFKGGIKGLAKMTAEATRLRLDIEGIAGMADEVFRPEGAVKMAAKLQVMGGEFAKLADPFQLMFKARNDFAGFAKDIGNATKEFVSFNAETGEILPATGLMLDRMREISNTTGISVEKLQEMGVQAKKLEAFGGFISSAVTDKEDRELIASLMEKDGKEWKVSLGDKSFNVKDLNDTLVDNYKREQETLDKRAENAQDFTKQLDGFMDNLRATLLPMARELKDGLGKSLLNLMDTWHKEGFYTNLGKFAEMGGKLASTMLSFIVDGVGGLTTMFGATGTLVAGLAAWGGMKALTWWANGRALGSGFLSTVQGSGMFGGKGSGMGPTGVMGKTARNTMRGKGLSGRMGKMGKSMAGKGMGIGMAGALGGMALDYGRGQLDEPDSGWGKAMGIGAGALEGAATGAMIGSIIPGIGTAAGAAIGGLAGGGIAAYKEFMGDEHNDYIVQGGKINPINKEDVNIGVKDGGVVDKMLGKGGAGGEYKHKFDEVKMSGKLELVGANGQLAEIDLENPHLVRVIQEKVNQGIEKAINGNLTG